jgi:hypothetical protein
MQVVQIIIPKLKGLQAGWPKNIPPARRGSQSSEFLKIFLPANIAS